MNKFLSNILIVLLLLFFSYGCNVDVVTALIEADNLTLTSPYQHQQIIDQDSDLYAWLIKWLEENREDWNVSPASYAPEYLIEGKDFHLNIKEEFAVINYSDSQKSTRQYVRNLNKSDYLKFKNKAALVLGYMLEFPDRSRGDWEPDKAIIEAMQDIGIDQMKIYFSGTIASYSPGVDSDKYPLVKDLPKANAGLGCVIEDKELRDAQHEYAKRYNEYIVEYLTNRN